MQVKRSSALVAVDSSGAFAAQFKPLRLNFAQVCLYCGVRWCESPKCVQRHAESLWAPCPTCDGFAQLANCAECMHGVVEFSPSQVAGLAGRTLPDSLATDSVDVVAFDATPDAANVEAPVDLSTVRDAGTGLTYAEIAHCIAASDMPTKRPCDASEDARQYIEQGRGRLGAQLRGRVVEALRLVQLSYRGATRDEKRAATTAHRQMWGGTARFNRAHRLAGWYWRTCATA